jgi:hypothetical protein
MSYVQRVAISVTHHWNNCWIRRTIATSARAYAVYRQSPVSRRVSLSQKATAASSATATPGPPFGRVRSPLCRSQKLHRGGRHAFRWRFYS